jgi:hypothetical protein
MIFVMSLFVSELFRPFSDTLYEGDLAVSRAHRGPPLTLAFQYVPFNFYNMVGSFSRRVKSS